MHRPRWRPPSLVDQDAAIWTAARPIEIDAGVRLTEFLCTSPARRGELVERIGAVQPPPPSAWAAHFATARDLFLDHMALRCLPVSAVIEQDPTGATRPHGQIEVRLPHDAVLAYVPAAIAALTGEPPAAAVVRAQGTRAEDLSRPIEDGARRMARLSDYRRRLTELVERPDARTDDLIKIAGEIART